MQGTEIIVWMATVIIVAILAVGSWQNARWVLIWWREWQEKRREWRRRHPDWTHGGLVPGATSAEERDRYLKQLTDWLTQNRTGTVGHDASGPFEEINPDAPAPPRP